MNNNPKIGLYGMGGWSQLFFFLFLISVGYTLAILLTFGIVDITQLWESPSTMRMALTIQTACLFLFPPVIFAFLCHSKPKEYLKAEHNHNWAFVAIAIFLIIAIQPTIGAIGYYNQQLTLPESMASIEKWMQENELSAGKTVALLFGDKTISGLIFNLFVMAIVAGLAEEFFFRGALQQIFLKITKNTHVAIWVTAFIFSAIHFQFYGFVPRLLLGALLGYIFVWSESIWIPVLVHTVNNAISVVLSYLYYGTPQYEKLDNFNFIENIWVIIPSFILSTFLLYLLYNKKAKQRIA